MLADFFTKPLQGHLFRQFRDVILGYSHIDTLQRDPAAAIEERVEENRPITREVAHPGEEKTTEEQVTGKTGSGNITWADVVKGRVVDKEFRE